MLQPKEQRKNPVFDFHVVLTTYEAVLSDVTFLGRFKWQLAVIDEAHRVKNFLSQTYQCLAKSYAITRCLLMTGTPVQNNYAELYALLSLALPKVFKLAEAQSFVAHFSGDGVDDAAIDQLHKLLAPILLRRTIADVPTLGTAVAVVGRHRRRIVRRARDM